MPDEKPTDDVEKLLGDQKSFEARKQALIADLLKQKEAAIRDYDAKLEKLGYDASGSSRRKRSHHKKSATPKLRDAK